MEEFKLISDIMKRRRSLFPTSYNGESFSKELLDQILYNANTAPSHAKTEPWRFHVVTEKGRSAFLEFMQNAYNKKFLGDRFNEFKYSKIAGKISRSSYIIAVNMYRDDDERIPEWEEIAAVACAVQNIYLSIAAAGLAGYWSTPSYVIENAREYFDMEDREKNLGLFYIGKPLEDLPDQVIKRPVEDKLKWY